MDEYRKPRNYGYADRRPEEESVSSQERRKRNRYVGNRKRHGARTMGGVQTAAVMTSREKRQRQSLIKAIFVASLIVILLLGLLIFHHVEYAADKAQEAEAEKTAQRTEEQAASDESGKSGTAVENNDSQTDAAADTDTQNQNNNDSQGAAADDSDGQDSSAVPQSQLGDYEMVINRSYPIAENFVAGTGELANIEGKQMEKNAAAAAEKMLAALRSNGMDIMLVSGYRTDDYQTGLYNRQIAKQGGNKLKAATISALPMTSEHQAGLAMDLSTDGTLEQNFAQTQQGQWLEKHCSEYGFILRYKKGKEKYTGVIWEPWHFRYMGSPEVAKKITASGKCLEEYYNKQLKPSDIDPYLPYLK